MCEKINANPSAEGYPEKSSGNIYLCFMRPIAHFLLVGSFLQFFCLSPLPARAAVFLIGLDGATWDIADPLIKKGSMPNLEKCINKGSRAILYSADFHLSPSIWTSIATGMKVIKHGIFNFFVGERRLTTKDRKRQALWNILSAHGRTVNSIGYMMTWPVEAVNGIMVSSLYFNQYVDKDVLYPSTTALAVPRDWKMVNHAEILRIASTMTSFKLPIPADKHTPTLKEPESFLFLRLLWHPIGSDEGYTRIAEEVLEKHKSDLFLIHIWGIDHVSHAFWKYQRTEPGASADHPFAEIIPKYYVYVDSLVGRVMRFAGPKDTVIILSDHGFTRRTKEEQYPFPHLSGTHHPDGIFAACGPSIRQVKRKLPVTPFDIAPTVLRILGLPAARDMAGSPMADLFKIQPPADYIDTYEPRPHAEYSPPGTLLSPDELELLKASGYI